MITDDYIALIYKNLKGEISPEEFRQLNQLSAERDELANLRSEIEQSWDLAGEIPKISTESDADQAFEKLLRLKNDVSLGGQEGPEVNSKVFHLKNYRRIISAVAAFLILSFGFWWFNQSNSEVFLGGTNGLALSLKDGSDIFLSPESRLEVKTFKSTREMTLEGKAHFKVKRDKERPFIIYTLKSRTEVLGTEFLLKESNDNSNIVLQVTEGKVQFSDISMLKKLIVEKNETAILDQDDLQKTALFTNLQPKKIRTLRYSEEKLEHVIQELMIIYDEEINVENKSLNTCIVSGTIPAKNIKSILENLTNQFNISLEKSGNNWMLKGGNCN